MHLFSYMQAKLQNLQQILTQFCQRNVSVMIISCVVDILVDDKIMFAGHFPVHEKTFSISSIPDFFSWNYVGIYHSRCEN